MLLKGLIYHQRDRKNFSPKYKVKFKISKQKDYKKKEKVTDKQDKGHGQKGYMHTYDWFMLKFDRKQQNSVKWLSFNKK